MQETINEIKRRGWDGIRGDYSGGHDEGGIQSMEGIILKQGVDPETVFDTDNHLPYDEYTERENNIAYKFNLKYPEWNKFPEINETLHQVYGSYAGEFECHGDFWVTRDGKYDFRGREGEMKWEDIAIRSNVGDDTSLECLS